MRDDDVDVIVRQWAQEVPDLDTRAMELFGRIYRISTLMGQRMTDAYAPYALHRSEFDVLATLRRAGEPYRLAPTDLARSMMITTGGMTGRLDRLVERGLVARVPHPYDNRRTFAQLTDDGKKLIEQAVVAGVAAQKFVADEVGEDLPALLDTLRDVLAVLDHPHHTVR